MQLMEPVSGGMEELFSREMASEEVREDSMHRGGEAVDLEIAHQMKELYDLVTKHNIDIFKDFDYV